MSDPARRLDSCLFRLVAAVTLIGVTALASNGGQATADQHSPAANTSSLVIGDAKKGELLYEASCVVCHGPRAKGGIGPRLAGNPILFNDEAFWKIVHEGRHMMPPLKGSISDQQMADIRAWLKTIQ